MSTTSSRMLVVTRPLRFGWRPVDVLFGTVRPREDRDVVMAGEPVQNVETREVRLFVAREGNTLLTAPLEA